MHFSLWIICFFLVSLTSYGGAISIRCSLRVTREQPSHLLTVKVICVSNTTHGAPDDPWSWTPCKKAEVNVDKFGAVGDGVSDDTKAFSRAWAKACSVPKSVFLVPKGRKYLVNATVFAGPCAGKLTVKIDGTIVAPSEPKHWDPKFARAWLSFANLTNVLFKGEGVIDGSGAKWWSNSCKRNKTNPCIGAPTALTLHGSSNIRFRDLTIRNSQQIHFTISHSDSVRVTNAQINAPGNSPNTDGIHISGSTNVSLKKCVIATGDDCVSIVSGSSNITMKLIYCGPGHGISIGSLGKNNSTDTVQNIELNGAFIRNTTNGVRIKSWQGGSGYAKGIRFQNVIMEDVQNPIIIDQFYCDSITSCKNQTKAVKISDIKFKNIFGTTPTNTAMKFACSDTVPCTNIVVSNIMLLKKNYGSSETFCNSASGDTHGLIYPPACCLTDYDVHDFGVFSEEFVREIMGNASFSLEHQLKSRY